MSTAHALVLAAIIYGPFVALVGVLIWSFIQVKKESMTEQELTAKIDSWSWITRSASLIGYVLFGGLVLFSIYGAGYKKGFMVSKNCVTWKVDRVDNAKEGYAFGNSECVAWQVKP